MNDPGGDDGALVIDPSPADWRRALRGFVAPRDPDRRRFRHELGMPLEAPIVMAGHQTAMWHPGIVAKYDAAEAARAFGASVAWLFVDQDHKDPFAVRYPVRDPVTGRLGVKELRFIGPRAASDTPAASRAALKPEAVEVGVAALPSVARGVQQIAESFAAHATKPNAGQQLAAVLGDLMRPTKPDAKVLATSLCRTHAFTEMVGRMYREPEACIHAYNAAVGRHPEAKLRPMTADDVNVRYELPLWRIEPGKPRRGVYAEDLPAIPVEQLAPKALFMTGLVRAFGCDLFIHGLGGGLYDRVTEEWLAAWLPGTVLAPTAVVSVTLRLPLITGPIPTSADVARAKWAAHHARHEPTLLGDAAGARHKPGMVERITRAKAGGGDPDAEYRSLHDFLEDMRRRRSDELARLQREADVISGKHQDAQIAADRTWPFPIYGAEAMERLRAAVLARFGEREPSEGSGRAETGSEPQGNASSLP